MNTNTDNETPDYGEPWACEPDGNGISIYARNDTVYSIQESFAWDEIYARRAVACVNACAGMADPAAEIAELRRERDELKAWKESALAVESEWDVQELAKMLGAKPGQSCRRVIHERVIELLASHAEMCARLHNATLKPKAKTFKAHGLTWMKHTPGDPMPCDACKRVVVILSSGELCGIYMEYAAMDLDWSVELPMDCRIIGWKYADAP